MHYDSLDDFLTELPALAASVEDKLRVQNGLFLVKLPKRQVCIRLEDGAVRVERRTDEYPNCIIEADEQLLLDMINGAVSPMKALLFGKIRVQGDVTPLLRLCALV